MNSPDVRVGPLLSRRQVMALFGATSVNWLMGELPTTATATADMPRALCIARPEQTEGPYFVDERLNRSDIRTDPADGRLKPGIPLALTVQVMRLTSGVCRPLPDAQVDIWHCDAKGIYSDVRDSDFNTIGQKFLRGYQITNAQGKARFLTIYPGWYPFRTVHVHVKIRTASIAGPRSEFTSQIYFPDELTDRVHMSSPYASMRTRRIRNRHDGIFRDAGHQLLVTPSPTTDGYTGTFPIGLVL